VTKTSVLFVDDEEHIRNAVGTYLDRRGYDVTLARDGEEAMRAITKSRPDILVADVMMPRMDGIELTRRLRAHPKTADLPILMLSARKQDAAVLAGYEAGADDYCAKPMQLSVLAAKIDALVRRRALAAPSPAGRARVITFVHAKGGVGTTTLLVNAASCSDRSPERSFVIDASLPMGDAAILLSLAPRRSLADLADCELPSIDSDLLQQVATVHANGLRVAAAPESPVDADRITGPIVRAAILAATEVSDLVYVDTAAAFTEVALAAIDAADMVCAVTAPHVSSLRATRQLLAVLQRMDVPANRIQVVLSRTTPRGVDDGMVREILGIERLTIIPYSEIFWTSGDEGQPLVASRPDSSLAAAIRQLADELRHREPEHRPSNVGDRLAGLIG
jgi:pilus assembly protein CpaE